MKKLTDLIGVAFVSFVLTFMVIGMSYLGIELWFYQNARDFKNQFNKRVIIECVEEMEVDKVI